MSSERAQPDNHRDSAKVRFFPPGIPLIAIALGVLLHSMLPINFGLEGLGGLRYWLGGAIVWSSIIALGAWSVTLFRRGGQSENPWKPTTHIVQSGPYRFTRNPMYLQMVLVCVGMAIVLDNVWILLLTPVVVLALQILVIAPEEQYLEQKFGNEYRTYKRKVRRWI